MLNYWSCKQTGMERTDTLTKWKQRAGRQEMVKYRKAEEWKCRHSPYWRIFLLFHGRITALHFLTHGGTLVNPLSRLERITDTTGQIKPLQTGDVHVLVHTATNKTMVQKWVEKQTCLGSWWGSWCWKWRLGILSLTYSLLVISMLSCSPSPQTRFEINSFYLIKQ